MYSAASKKEDDDAQPVKKTYTWNTKEEAKQAFKELLKEKVFQSTSLHALQNYKTCICQKLVDFFLGGEKNHYSENNTWFKLFLISVCEWGSVEFSSELSVHFFSHCLPFIHDPHAVMQTCNPVLVQSSNWKGLTESAEVQMEKGQTQV